ncbi:MAG: UDP-N-acetylmuramate dehydrogenase [Verrucomicrobia bacterium]|nr:UDP-N-acetylmuramate dehydrogenase [Verrucomicrobiota bacterium]
MNSTESNPKTSLPQNWQDELEAILNPGTLRKRDYPMKKLTTLRIGGPADFYVEPSSLEELKKIRDFCKEKQIPAFLLGRGSNLLVRDGGIRGVVYSLKHPSFTQIELIGNHILIQAGAGASMRSISMFAQANGLGGLEFMEGIPGSLGGGLRMNAGAYKSSLFDVLESVKFLSDDNQIQELPAKEIEHGYRSCPFFRDHLALSAVFRVYSEEPEKILEKMHELREKRLSAQTQSPSAGCAFKNPEGASAGQIIDSLGMKGLVVNGAQISDKHANFLINRNNATAKDVLTLIQTIRDRVYAERGIKLETEVMIVGEDLEMENRKINVTVFAGGISSERSVSLASGKMVVEALRSKGYEVNVVDPDPAKGWTLPEKTDVVFLALHGTYGEDGQVQTELDRLGVPYTGCGAEASRIGFDKLLTRQRCEAAGIRMPRALVLDQPLEKMPEGWKPPVVLKPIREGSSVGLQLVDKEEDFAPALKAVLKFGGRVIMEERIFGRELAAGVLDGKPLPLVEICPKSGVYDYTSKYTKGCTEYICPAVVEETIKSQAQQMALQTFNAIGGKDYARVDILLDKEGRCWVLEINTLPGMCETSLLPKAAAVAGISYPELCSMMVQLALKK